MAHKSRLGSFVIDCRTDDIDDAARFWSDALGYPMRRNPDPADAHYINLDADRDEATNLVDDAG